MRRSISTIRPLRCWLTPAVTARSIQSGGWQSRAYALVGTLKREFAHPAGGFREDRDGRLTLRANPHMHLLEAALAWLAIDPNPIWRDLADEIVALCLDRFIDRDTAALREFFASDWTPIRGTPGEVLEPGHHYEWAFLLDRWAKLTGRDRPAEVLEAHSVRRR